MEIPYLERRLLYFDGAQVSPTLHPWTYALIVLNTVAYERK